MTKTTSSINDLGNVLIRSDLNVPIINNNISDEYRIYKSLEILDKIYNYSRTITFSSHLGRPKKNSLDYSLEPVSKKMTEIINQKVNFIDEIYGKKVNASIENSESKINLIENLRLHEGELNNDDEFAKNVTFPFDTYIFDAFGASHRNHASVVSFGKYLDSYQGPLMNNEIEQLDKLLVNEKTGYVVLLGGAKISDKLSLIDNLLPKVEHLLIGGGMCFTFLKSMGYEIGNSLLEDSFISKANELLNSEHGHKIVLPSDFGVTELIESELREDINIEDFRNNHIGIDIGPNTISAFASILLSSKNIFWNGPMGVFEIDKFSKGTQEITEIIAKSSAYTCIGGGDSVSAINKFSNIQYFNHISTGGGASLEYLEGKKLPGVNIYNSLII
jgi:3-phosphoglycerate kinase